MIAKSDLVILVLSASALAVGVYRWHQNTNPVPAVRVAATSPAPASVIEPEERALFAQDSDGQLSAAVTPTVRRLDSNADSSLPPSTVTSVVRVASETDPIVAAVPDSMPAAVGEPLYGVYRVKSGDYLGKIAQRVGTSVATLRKLNDIKGTTIQIGQRIRYPQAAN